MLKIVTIGGSGLVGSKVNEILSQKYSVQDLSRKTGIDITKRETLEVLQTADYKYVLLYTAKADVDGSEADKPLGEDGEAYKLNVTAVRNVLETMRPDTTILYISTDFVFDGEKTPEGGYTEQDPAHAVNWYGETKLLGEEEVRKSGKPYIIARIGYPYRKEFEPKKDFARAIRDRLTQGLPISAVTDHIMTPTYIDDVGIALGELMETSQTGTFHITGSQSLSPYDASLQIAKNFGLDRSLITKTTRDEFFKGRAKRPFNLTMNNAKIQQLGIQMRTFEQGLEAMKKK